MDNYGILAMLRRKVEKIIVCINSSHCTKEEGVLPPGIRHMFGDTETLSDSITAPLLGDDMSTVASVGRNHVFSNDNNELEELTNAVIANNESMDVSFHSGSYSVIQNDNYDITPYTAEVFFVFLDKSAESEEVINELMAEDLEMPYVQAGAYKAITGEKKSGKEAGATGFPHFSTYTRLGLSDEEVGLLANYTTWCMLEIEEELNDFMFGKSGKPSVRLKAKKKGLMRKQNPLREKRIRARKERRIAGRGRIGLNGRDPSPEHSGRDPTAEHSIVGKTKRIRPSLRGNEEDAFVDDEELHESGAANKFDVGGHLQVEATGIATGPLSQGDDASKGCDYCGMKTHTYWDCPKRKKDQSDDGSISPDLDYDDHRGDGGGGGEDPMTKNYNSSKSNTSAINIKDADLVDGASITLKDATAGTEYEVDISHMADDPDEGDVITFSKVQGPAWLQVDGEGHVWGTPTPDDVGSNRFTLRVTDLEGASSDAKIIIHVESGNRPPRWKADLR
jgi:hypothetical protein